MATDLYNAKSLESKGVPVGSTFDYVVLYARCALTNLTLGQRYRSVIKTHGTKYYSSWQTPIVTQYLTFTKTWTNNPNTGQPWTWSELNDVQIGVELDPNENSSFPVYGTQAYLRVYYTEPIGGIQHRWLMMGDSHR